MRGIASSIEYGRSWTCAAAAVNFLPCFAMCLLVVQTARVTRASHLRIGFGLWAHGSRRLQPRAESREPGAWLPEDVDAHRSRGAAHCLHRGRQIGAIQIGHLLPGDLFDLLGRDCADLVAVRFGRAL